MADKKNEENIDIDDLQAAIDASARATIKGGADAPQPAKAEKEAAPAEEKAEEKTDDKGEKVEIKASAVSVDTPEETNDEAPTSTEEDHMVSRHGKTITPLSEQSDEPAAEESAPEEVEVKEEPKPEESVEEEPADKADIKTDSQEHSIAVNIKSKPKPKSTAKAPAGTISDIAPAKSESTVKVDDKDEENTPEEEKPEEPEAKEEEKAEPKNAESEEKAAQPAEESKDDKAKADKNDDGSIKIQSVEKKKKDKDDPEQNAASIFDTKEYHLPIRPSRHHRRGQISPLWLAVILFLAVAGGGAWYVTNNDVKLPFISDDAETAQTEQIVDPSIESIEPSDKSVDPPTDTVAGDHAETADEDALRQADINAIHAALEVYYTDNGVYPAGAQSLSVVTLIGITNDVFSAPNGSTIGNGNSPTQAQQYVYESIPNGCENATTNCTSYSLRAYQSSGTAYVKDALN